ncbi:MAG: hypothetical protein CL878_01290 [Dehalococcoidia bacterium]|nr:hypothetical protein [Dehalococcoidia bacterium]
MMTTATTRGTVVEPQKEVPIAYDVDVAVVGAGIAGLFAGLAAGRQGAKTLLIDRFGSLGGNIGPAMIVAGGLYNEGTGTLVGGLSGLPKELIDRVEALRTADNYADETNLVSYLGVKLAEEYGVELLLSVWAADPIIEAGRVTGLFVEGKSGRVAVRAKVVVDATSDADLARRADVPMITELPPDPSFAPLVRPELFDPSFRLWNDAGLFYLVANVDLAAYRAFAARRVTLSAADQAWVDARNEERTWIHQPTLSFPPALLPLLREAWEAGTFRYLQDVEPQVQVESRGEYSLINYGPGLTGSQVAIRGAIRREDIQQHSRLEAAVRVHSFETVQFYRAHVPGFEQAYLLFAAPYFGSRGGPCIDGEHTLTPQEAYTGQRFDDVMFRNTHEGQPQPWHGGEPTGFDAPYRMLRPRGLDGLLVSGGGAAYLRRGHDPTGMRCRPSMMALGEVTGIAAALAVQTGTTPRTLEVPTLQRELLRQGAYLGDEARLAELGLR